MTAFRTFVLLIAGALAVSPQGGAQRGPQVEWLYYGGDPGNSKYSPLTDINAGNVQRLQIAWQWKHWETPLPQYGTTPGFFESTPLMIDGVLYVTTPYNSIAALDAETGKELWRFDGEAYKLGQILVGQRLEAARHGLLARWRQAAHVPEQPPSAVLARCAEPANPSPPSATTAWFH